MRLIPKLIHYCWFGQHKDSEKLQQCLQSWQRIMPDYQIKEWNEANSPMDSVYIQTAYENKLWSKISNLVRLYAVYMEGGLYFDTDIEVLKRFDPLLHNECFLGFQQEKKDGDWVNNAVIGAVPRHPFLSRCMNETFARFLQSQSYYRSPEATTKLLIEMGLSEYGLQTIGNVQLYPADYFYPYPWWGNFDPDCITANTYCVHHWQLSWVAKDGKPHTAKLPSKHKTTFRVGQAAPGDRIGSLEMEIIGLCLRDRQGQEANEIKQGESLQVEILHYAPHPICEPIFGLTIEREDGLVCFETSTQASGLVASTIQGTGHLALCIDHLDLTGGTYYLDIGVYEQNWAYAYDYHWRVCPLHVRSAGSGKGILQPPHHWEMAEVPIQKSALPTLKAP